MWRKRMTLRLSLRQFRIILLQLDAKFGAWSTMLVSVIERSIFWLQFRRMNCFAYWYYNATLYWHMSWYYNDCTGIVDGGNLDWTAMSVWRRVLEVNFFAVVAISKAMLPFLKRSPGSRIVNVSSLAGITGAPGMGPYFASKHAVEGMAKCAREELSHWDIHMSNINPGFMR